MGYYSDVAITLYEKDFKELLKAAVIHDNKNNGNYNSVCDLLRNSQVVVSNDTVSLLWTSEKWYDSFSDVAFIMDYIQDIPHFFRRIGESYDVYEYYETDEAYELYDAVTFVRCFETDGKREAIDKYLTDFETENETAAEPEALDMSFDDVAGGNTNDV